MNGNRGAGRSYFYQQRSRTSTWIRGARQLPYGALNTNLKGLATGRVGTHNIDGPLPEMNRLLIVALAKRIDSRQAQRRSFLGIKRQRGLSQRRDPWRHLIIVTQKQSLCQLGQHSRAASVNGNHLLIRGDGSLVIPQ